MLFFATVDVGTLFVICRLTPDGLSFILKEMLSGLNEFYRFKNKLKIEDQTMHMRHILFFHFRKRKNLSEVSKKRQCQTLLQIYALRCSSIQTGHRLHKIAALIKPNLRYTMRDVVKTFKVN